MFFTVGKFSKFNDYKFCQRVTHQVSNAVSFPVSSFEHILLINNNEMEIYFAFKEPEGTNSCVRFELNKEIWEKSKTIKAVGKKIDFIQYQLLQEI